VRQTIWSGMLPMHADVADEWMGDRNRGMVPPRAPGRRTASMFATRHADQRSTHRDTPMCRVARCGLQRLDNHCLDLVIADSPRCAIAWLVEKTGYSFGNKSRAPVANPGVGRAQLARHLTVGAAAAAAQHDLCAHRKSMSGLATCCPAFQRRSVRRCQSQLRQPTTAGRRRGSKVLSRHLARLVSISGMGH
jgi:hypothetical protein